MVRLAAQRMTLMALDERGRHDGEDRGCRARRKACRPDLPWRFGGRGRTAESCGPSGPGEGCQGRGPAGLARGVHAGRVAGSGRPAAGSGQEPGARTGSDPLRADAGLAIHLLPWRRAHHGLRPGHHSRVGPKVQICGDAHLSNFGLFASPERQADVRRQRLRRDAAWAVGVGSQAACRQRGGRRPGPRVHGQGGSDHRARQVVESYRREMQLVWRGCPLSTLWYSHVDVDGCSPSSGHSGQDGPKARADAWHQGPYPRQPPGAEQAHHRRRWPAPHRE